MFIETLSALPLGTWAADREVDQVNMLREMFTEHTSQGQYWPVNLRAPLKTAS